MVPKSQTEFIALVIFFSTIFFFSALPSIA